VAVALDGGGAVIASSPLRVLAGPVGRPSLVAALVRISPEVEAVELRRERLVLHRIARSDERPRVSDARLGPPRDGGARRLTWKWTGGRRRLELALERRGIATPVLSLPDAAGADVRLTRYAAADRLFLVGSDGWNAAERVVERFEPGAAAVAIENPHPVAIRRVARGQYCADVPEGWSARWSLGAGEAREGLAIRVADRARGVLVLEASSPEGARVRDERPLGAEGSP
jgi:hypothetical protein